MVINLHCTDFDAMLERFLNDDYRLEMIEPADAPRTALLSRNSEIVRLLSEHIETSHPLTSDWKVGRAGMMYRDLMSDRMGGRLAVSHIRLTAGGAVPDYVHYHKIEFQMIRCIKGRIRVVYEDQGEPFWLEPGDWVIQPPEIRHRVLEAEAGSEVIEISMPAEHETWVDHDMSLPTSEFRPDRDFNGQRFVRHVAKK